MLITRQAPSTARQATTFTRATSLVPRPSQPVAAHPATPVRGACAAACASGTFSGVTLGAECGYSTTKSALSKYAAACQYVQPDFTVSAKMAEVMKTPGSVFSGAYYHKVSSEMQVGAEIKKAASKSDVDLAFGCLYKLDKSTTVKGKVRPPPPPPPPPPAHHTPTPLSAHLSLLRPISPRPTVPVARPGRLGRQALRQLQAAALAADAADARLGGRHGQPQRGQAQVRHGHEPDPVSARFTREATASCNAGEIEAAGMVFVCDSLFSLRFYSFLENLGVHTPSRTNSRRLRKFEPLKDI